jgi:hypothetical protein
MVTEVHEVILRIEEQDSGIRGKRARAIPPETEVRNPRLASAGQSRGVQEFGVEVNHDAGVGIPEILDPEGFV